MRKRIFFGILVTSSLTGIITAITTAAVIWSNDSEHCRHLIAESIMPILIAVLGMIVLLALIAATASGKIVRPIKDIDPDRPVSENAYKELRPILDRLSAKIGKVNQQSKQIMSQREQFSLITESMKEGIVIADPKTAILSCNSTVQRLLGIDEPIMGESIFTLCREDGFRRCIQDAMGGRRAQYLLKAPSGDRKIIASPAAIDDAVNGIVVFIMDVTEEQELERMRREFTSNVSHELKTPLTTIYGVADMLANGMVKSEDVAKFGGDIRNEADRLITLISDIVALSMLDEDSVPESDEEVDLYELSGEIMERLESCAVQKNISGKLTGDHVTIIGSRTVLDEVLYNLCDNAIKYGNVGGSYEVRVSHVNKRAMITVSDDGIGIGEEHLERIFERFYRVDKSRSKKIKGTGLGLSIVKHGVMYHGGTVHAVSEGRGTKFIVELPFKKAE